ncbi:hypothetical protein QGN32_05285 [Mycolicibacterium sp. ND9-15]|uniref:hypothetical protein n=1 Tax=Mycolicibacterium sp. ND9-15 TaxID=3042320 RepID=UPI002DDC0FB0|nr:hypothetical protein [Mycolicibacterium sp. ND9-15]WSE57311.1 hypothetical protein QGN32_05285 [Mycolicibacterium sp. ND9-15]
MGSNSAFTGVAAVGMPRSLHAVATAAHPAHAAGAAAAITPQRKRRAAAATAKSVDRGTI